MTPRFRRCVRALSTAQWALGTQLYYTIIAAINAVNTLRALNTRFQILKLFANRACVNLYGKI